MYKRVGDYKFYLLCVMFVALAWGGFLVRLNINSIKGYVFIDLV